jgi:hypothetical protein
MMELRLLWRSDIENILQLHVSNILTGVPRNRLTLILEVGVLLPRLTNHLYFPFMSYIRKLLCHLSALLAIESIILQQVIHFRIMYAAIKVPVSIGVLTRLGMEARCLVLVQHFRHSDVAIV